MTKSKKIIICCIIGSVIMLLIWFVGFSSYTLHVSYPECVSYDDFDSVKDDFARIAELARQQGNGTYLLFSTGLQKLGDWDGSTKYEEVPFSEEDKQRSKRIDDYCYSNAHYGINSVRVTDDYVRFELDDFIGCGIVNASSFTMRMKYGGIFNEYGFHKLAGEWYSYYR